MYQLKLEIQGALVDEDDSLILTTDKRGLAEAVKIIAEANGLGCEVVRTAEAKPVKFKGM